MLFRNVSWERAGSAFKVHFMRNLLLVHIPHQKKIFCRETETNLESTEPRVCKAICTFNHPGVPRSLPQTIALFKEGLEDSLQFLAFPHLDQRKISSTNSLERVHKEIHHRTRVVGIFPTTNSYLRLVTSYLIEYTKRLDE